MPRRRWLVLLLPSAVVIGLELVVRTSQIATFEWYAPGSSSFGSALAGSHALSWLLSFLHGAILWGSLLILASGPRPSRHVGTPLFIALFTVALGAQSAFRARWAVYLSRDATELTTNTARSVLGSLRLDGLVVLWFLFAAVAALGSVALARRLLEPSRQATRIAALVASLAITCALTIPVSYRGAQATTPDVLWFNAVSFAVRGPEPERAGMSSPQLRAPDRVAPLQARPPTARNVLLLLQESQRADVTCVAHDADCALATPFTNNAAKGRFPLLNLRSNGSATTIAMNGLFTGLPPTASKDALRRAPNLFELARAAGYDAAYFTSHHLMFANMWLLVDTLPHGRVTLGTHLDPRADMWRGAEDAELSQRVAEAWGLLREPFFVVVHYSNIHAPRRAGHGAEPFQPASEDKGDREQYFNGYKNAVHQSDEAVAALITHVRGTPAGERTVILYTADHGEANGEHDQGCDHGCTLFEEEVRVPGWVDAPLEVLSNGERTALSEAKTDYVFHTDFAPTVLDLLGLWDSPELGEVRGRMIGAPLTRARAAERRAVPLSNVSHVWERGLPSYGLMSGRLKLIGRHREPGYRCFDVEADPREQRPLSVGCEALLDEAESLYGVPPSGMKSLHDLATSGP